MKNLNLSFVKWPTLEGGVRSVNYIFAGFLGIAALELPAFLSALCIIGALAAIGSIALAIGNGIEDVNLLPPNALKGIYYGISETAGTVLILLVFRNGGDLAYTALFVSLSLFLSGIFDPDKMHKRQWIGVAIYFIAVIVGTTDLLKNDFESFPIWMVFAFLIPVATTVEELITKRFRKNQTPRNEDSPYVFTFWVNLTVFLLAAVALLAIDDKSVSLSSAFMIGAIGMGVMSIFKVITKVRSYDIAERFIAVKNIVMFSVLFAGSAIFGLIFFDQPISGYKVISWAIFILAYFIARGK